LDGVALILPDAASKELQLYALDFPDGKGVLHEDMSRPLDGSLAGQVFRTGKPWVGHIEELNGSGFGN
jgi:formate hydrogenlyase transcriptional activator